MERVAASALRMTPPLYFRSIFGPLPSVAPPHRRFSEYDIFNPWRPVRMLRYVSDATFPALPTYGKRPAELPRFPS